jgi:YesN/AraC family two-component response regulator
VGEICKALGHVTIKNIVFEESFKTYAPTSLKEFFYNCHDEEENNKPAKTAAESLYPQLSAESRNKIQKSLDEWCEHLGYKDTTVNMLTLSRSLDISKDDLSAFFDQCQKSTFRLWLSDIRFNAAKKMMSEYPDYSNDIISAECGFSSRTYLYRLFKEKEGCTPTEWRDKQTV